MFERDYLMRMLKELADAIVRTIERETEQEKHPETSAELLDAAVGSAVDMDADTFLSLAPESISTILQVSGTDPRAIEYITRSLALSASYYSNAGIEDMGTLRLSQARSIAQAYGINLPDTTDITELETEALNYIESQLDDEDII
jgi:hypothetical protein